MNPDNSDSGNILARGWEVDDLATVVTELRGRGVVFEEVDSEGNLIGIGEPVR